MADANVDEKREKRLGIVLLCMCSSLVIAGYIITPLLFYYAATATEAGRLAGSVFQICNGIVLLLGLAAIDAFWQLGEYNKRVWLPLLLLLDLIALNGFVLTPIIENIKEAAGPIELLAQSDPQRQNFGMWHGITAMLHLVITACSVWLVFHHYTSRRSLKGDEA